MVGVVFYTHEGKMWLGGRAVTARKFRLSKDELLVKYTWPIDGLEYLEPIHKDWIIPRTHLLIFDRDGVDDIGYWFKAVQVDVKSNLYQYTYSDGQVWEKKCVNDEIMQAEATEAQKKHIKSIKSDIKKQKPQPVPMVPSRYARPQSTKDTEESMNIVKSQLIRDKFLFILAKNADEFHLLNDLTRNFFKNSFQIVEAYVIENESQKNFKKMNIRHVFHGTPTVQSIVVNGFDCKRAKTCLFGQGLYFSENPNVSLSYSSTSYIIVAQISEPEQTVTIGETMTRRKEGCVHKNVHWICKDSVCCIPKYLIKLIRT